MSLYLCGSSGLESGIGHPGVERDGCLEDRERAVNVRVLEKTASFNLADADDLLG